MLPYLLILIEKVSLLINDDKRDEFGKQMIEIACKELDKDSDIFRTFIKMHTGSTHRCRGSIKCSCHSKAE